MLVPTSTGRVHEEDTMTEQRRVQPDWDDVQGHKVVRADAESAEGDTEGHAIRKADAESAEADTEGHGIRHGGGADAESAEGDDTEGHALKR
jgi:hypothetical protein